MVIASVSTEPERKELKTLEGGFVVLRRMSYGEKLHRSEMATKQAAVPDEGSRKISQLNIELLTMKVAEWEFANLIVEHNLEYAASDGPKPFEFKRKGELSKLDPRVGDEINAFIAEMNNFEEDDQKGN
jgi:hypothetical protein